MAQHKDLTGTDLHGSKFIGGDGSPVGVVTPTIIGQVYYDQTNDLIYVATGLTNADWKSKLNDHILDTTSAHDISSKANKAWGSPTTATLENSWTGTLRYYKNSDLGLLVIDGNITSGTVTNGTTVATLPVGYRPAYPASFLTSSGSDGTTKTGFRLGIDGAIKVYGVSAGSFNISAMLKV